MLTDFLFSYKLNNFVFSVNLVFSSIIFWLSIAFLSFIFIKITILKTKKVKNITDYNDKFEIFTFVFTFVFNLLIIFVLNVLSELFFSDKNKMLIILLNLFFLGICLFFIITKKRYFDIVTIFNKLIALLFLIVFAPVIFNLILKVIIQTDRALFFLMLWIIPYFGLVFAIILNTTRGNLKILLRRINYGILLLLLILFFNLQFIENSKDIKLWTIFESLLIILLILIYANNLVLISEREENNENFNDKKDVKKDLPSYILAIKNDDLIMDKTIKYTSIFINGYKQVLII